jgi:hypothetical protein
MSDLQLCKAKPLRKHEVGFIANRSDQLLAKKKSAKWRTG